MNLINMRLFELWEESRAPTRTLGEHKLYTERFHARSEGRTRDLRAVR